MIDDPPDVIDWRAFGPLLKDAQERLGRVEARLEKQEETIKAGFQVLAEGLFNANSETRMVSNRLSVVENTVREMEGVVRWIEGDVRASNKKLDLILKHLGLDKQ